MRSFKKAVISTALFFAITVSFSLLIYEPFANSEIYSFMDSGLRKSLTGKIDFLILGSSPGMRAFDTKVYDDTINVFSYNASGAYMPWNGRLAMLEEEICRQPLKIVVIEINSLSQNDKSSAEGHLYVQPRITEFADRLSYFINNVSSNNFESYYSYILQNGIKYYSYALKSTFSSTNELHQVDYTL